MYLVCKLNEGCAGRFPYCVATGPYAAVVCVQVAPANGFEPSWRDPLIAAVVIVSFIIAALLFVTMASFKRQRLLLQQTVVSPGPVRANL